jgi:hypothetical protein
MKPPKALPIVLLLLLGAAAPPLAAQTLTDLGLLPATVNGGTTTFGQVTVSSATATAPIVVSLSSSNPAVAAVPATATIAMGTTSKVFTITNAAVQSTQQATISAQYGGVNKTAVLTVEPDYPPFYDNPPATLLMGGFTLVVTDYEAREWDWANSKIINAKGTATTTLTCDGAVTTLPVRFTGCTIESAQPGVESVTAGTARWQPAVQPPLPIEVVGFKLLLEDLLIDSLKATATGAVRFPGSVADLSTPLCRSAQVHLGSFPITANCEFYVSSSAGAFGPWAMVSTGIKFQGTGFTADFSTTQTPSLNPPQPATWRGVVLDQGETIPAAGMPVSNTGYLAARYGFTKLLANGFGLQGTLTLIGDFTFKSLDPFGYQIHLPGGSLSVVNSGVAGGSFAPSGITIATVLAPLAAARMWDGALLTLGYSLLTVQPDLDLYAEVSLPEGSVYWGNLTDPVAPTLHYGLREMRKGHLFLSSRQRTPYQPLDANGNFKQLAVSNPAVDLELAQAQGLTLLMKEQDLKVANLRIRTTDTPSDALIQGNLLNGEGWLVVSARGVHGDLSCGNTSEDEDRWDLGPTDEASYLADPNGDREPFKLQFFPIYAQSEGLRYVLRAKYVDSAVYDFETRGGVDVPYPIGAQIPIEDLAFTSTAHCPGAKIVLDDPLVLNYWNVELVEKQQGKAAGVMSVKTGQIFLTAAGIQEKVHFAKPFWLLWGEVFPTSVFGKFDFDYDSTGQKFDGFQFVPEVIALSPYDSDDPDEEKSFLQAAGTVHFDFFGAKALDVRDYYFANAAQPFYHRRIELGFDGLNGADPTDDHLARKWSGPFGNLKFELVYDDGDQNGFLSSAAGDDVNAVEVEYFAKTPLWGQLNLSAERACISVHRQSVADFSIPPIVNFCQLKAIHGCGCIEEGQLKRFDILSEVNSGGTDVMLRTGGYLGVEISLTPSTTEYRANGQLFVNLFSGAGDLQIIGQGRFLFDRAAKFTEGDLLGKIDAGSYLGIVNNGSLSAEGQLSWHLGKLGGDSYDSLQGRLKVAVVTPGGTAGYGVEGGFYVGLNAPSAEAWAIKNTDPRFQFDLDLPERLTGVFGYAKYAQAVNIYVLAGGYELYGGFGGFVDLNSNVPLPYLIGQMRTYVWGEFLGGLLAASAWGDLQFNSNLLDPSFQGTIGVKGCVAWLICEDVEVDMLVDSDGVQFKS